MSIRTPQTEIDPMLLGALVGLLVVLVWWFSHALHKTAMFCFLLLIAIVALGHY
jgi:hypothetical protein